MPDLHVLDPVLTTLFGLVCTGVGGLLGWFVRGRRTVSDPPAPIASQDDLTDDMEDAIHQAAVQYAAHKGHPFYGDMAEPIAQAAVRKAMRYQQQYFQS